MKNPLGRVITALGISAGVLIYSQILFADSGAILSRLDQLISELDQMEKHQERLLEGQRQLAEKVKKLKIWANRY